MPPDSDVAEHAARVDAMRERRNAGLRDPLGWLSLVGLHWLPPGRSAFGGAPGAGISLVAAGGAIPASAGAFEVADGRVLVHPGPDPGLAVEGEPVPDGLELTDDAAEDGPTMLELGSLRLYLIRRGEGRLAIRVKDTEAPALRTFPGVDCYPVDPAWRLIGRLESAEPGATIAVPDVVGDILDEPTPGDVLLEIGGEHHRLHALESMPGHLWLVFGDATNGSETYGGGRFLVSGPVQADGSVELDFNLAYNPPCVFSLFATCPLPPKGNRLPMRIEAGERGYVGGAGTSGGHAIGPG